MGVQRLFHFIIFCGTRRNLCYHCHKLNGRPQRVCMETIMNKTSKQDNLSAGSHNSILKTKITALLLAVLLVVALVAVLASAAIQLVLMGQMETLASALVTAAEYVPYYPMLVGVSLALCLLAVVVELVSVLKQPLPGLPCAVGSTVLMLAGIAVARFGFYCAHLTAGI